MPLDTSLTLLENAQLIRPVAEPDPAYIFKNALSQQAAYQSLLTKNRRELHRHVAETYEKLYADRLDEIAALLAEHYAQAGDNAKTFEYSARAGDQAARVYANAEALTHYTRAVELGKAMGLADLARLYLSRGRALELSGQYDAALKNYKAMEEWARAHNDLSMELAAWMALATILSIPTVVVDIKKSRQLSEQALARARDLGDEPAQAKILWNLHLLLSRVGQRFSEALEYGEQSIEIARRLGLREQLAYTLNDIAELYFIRGQPEHGEQLLGEAAALWRDLNNLPMLTDNWNNAALVHLLTGQFERAIQDATDARELSQSIGNLWGEVYSGTWIGRAYFELGRPAEAIAVMQDAIRLAPQTGFQSPLVVTRADLGRVYADLGAAAQGEALVEAALAISSGPQASERLWVVGMAAHFYIFCGKFDQADAALVEAHEYHTGDDAELWLIAVAELAEAERDLVREEYGRALTSLESLITKLQAKQLRLWLPNAHYLRARTLAAQKRWDDARSALAQAQAKAEGVHARWSLWQILALLAKVERARGHRAEALAAQRAARQAVTFVLEHTPPELRDSFLNLPDVREVME